MWEASGVFDRGRRDGKPEGCRALGSVATLGVEHGAIGGPAECANVEVDLAPVVMRRRELDERAALCGEVRVW